MTSRRHRIDFSLRRRRNNPSLTSSGSASPTVPVLQSPVTFQAFASVNVSETTLKQKNKLERAPVRPSMFLEEKDDDETSTPALAGGAPVDIRPAHVERKSVEEKPMTQTRSQYFEDAFSTRGPLTSPRSQISQDSVVVVEIKINTKVKELESLVSNISSHMARIFQKSETFMMTTIQEEACIHFGKSSLPAYLMKVFALPYLIAPITNLRSTILIQAALQEIIHVAPNRGVILYIPISEENFATNGVTMMGELARLERSSPDHGPGLFRSISRTMSRRLKSSSSQSAPISVTTTSSWACGGGGTQASSVTGKDSQCSEALRNEGKPKSGTKPKGFRHFLSRQGSGRLQQPGDNQ
ncbi:MIF domain protein [Aspergillus sclerotioniger CBS 115572]|uniref:L-dopachrome isomerase n=1 Tax=Aspergillus sclerotioniger CBS 115572 TaxID=1450535 RepID=A0A317X9V8_9EURO|nr:MIF domain protein [Aspergillus sclerotioniger CBS 115572]PWY95334.1 MIF domain protein [Aspergillus sclerotioniger CBS 115572]